jgi:hypothetical protein
LNWDEGITTGPIVRLSDLNFPHSPMVKIRLPERCGKLVVEDGRSTEVEKMPDLQSNE